MRDKSLTEEIAVSDNDIENNTWARVYRNFSSSV